MENVITLCVPGFGCHHTGLYIACAHSTRMGVRRTHRHGWALDTACRKLSTDPLTLHFSRVSRRRWSYELDRRFLASALYTRRSHLYMDTREMVCYTEKQ